MQQAVRSAKPVFHSVTSVRGLAAFGVCWFHMVVLNGLLADGWLARSAEIGWLGPHVFFIVSGFVVPWSLFVVGYRRRDAGRYLARRIVRLDPPYFATIALILGLDMLAAAIGLHGGGFAVDWSRLASHVAYLTAILGEVWYTPVFWTLAIEFQFYLLLSLLFPLIASRRRWLRWLLLVLCLAAFLPFCEWPQATIEPVPEFPGSIWVVGYLPLFMLGFLLFQVRAGIIGKRELWAWAIPLMLLSGSYTYVLAPLTFIAFALMLEDRVRNRVTEFLGRISYSLYLVHVPVGKPFQSIAARFVETDLQRTVVVLISVAVCVFAAWVFYHLVERPSVRLARRIAVRTPRRAANRGRDGVLVGS